VPTVSITVAKDISKAVKVPRAIFVPWPMGHHFGVPFHKKLQSQIINEALQLVYSAEQSGTIVDLPIKWANVRREAKIISEQGRRL
jgi:hypothetical protein